MTKAEAIKYCYLHKDEFIRECGDGGREFDCLIEIIESDTIQPDEISDYGMEF